MPGRIHATQAAPPAIAARDAERRKSLGAEFTEVYPEPIDIVFEIGCGHGHFLAAYAAANPKTHCLGVDLVSKRIERAERKQRRFALHNLAFFKADAVETLAILPKHVRLEGIFVLFPDPWPKKRHHRRRILQPSLLDALAVRAKPGAWLALRTDDALYFDWASKQIENHHHWHIAPEFAWPFEHSTYFQEIKGPHQSLMCKWLPATNPAKP